MYEWMVRLELTAAHSKSPMPLDPLRAAVRSAIGKSQLLLEGKSRRSCHPALSVNMTVPLNHATSSLAIIAGTVAIHAKDGSCRCATSTGLSSRIRMVGHIDARALLRHAFLLGCVHCQSCRN